MSREVDIAIIGMACRFPGAPNVTAFWRNLRNGVESIVRQGSMPAVSGEYVLAGSVLDAVDRFDAAFFGYSPREAEVIDPQQRLFLECAWEAIEDSGYPPCALPGCVGVFAGMGMNAYFINNVHPSRGFRKNRNFLESMDDLQLTLGNDADYLATRVSHKLGLSGLSVNVQTACSTSLVAVHLACQSLLTGECDAVLAGAANVMIPQLRRYRYEAGLVHSSDGFCRAFDARANGTVFGSGVGVVLLKLLSKAIADRDPIYAVIKGSAVNNDGNQKAGFTAPSVTGQAAVVSEALAVASVASATVGYVEAHGTATALGDPVEIEALTRAFGPVVRQYCAIGSVKTNIGHLGWAAGIASLIKTALALYHREIPPSLHFQAPNPQIDFPKTPFFVNTKLMQWECNEVRRAGVSAFGLGGTNAHIVMEEPPRPTRSPNPRDRGRHVIKLSARSSGAIRDVASQLVTACDADPTLNLADLAYTSNVGRHDFEYRVAVTARSTEELKEALRYHVNSPNAIVPARNTSNTAILFAGLGSEYPGMGRDIYETSPTIRTVLNRCESVYREVTGRSLLDAMFGVSGGMVLLGTSQPAVFALECALYDLLRSWGIQPAVVMGHSLGEYVAAYAAGVIGLEAGLRVVTERGMLMDRLAAGGGMLTVMAGCAGVEVLVDGTTVTVAADNGPMNTVVAGSRKSLEEFASKMEGLGIKSSFLNIATAGHSQFMKPVASGVVCAIKSAGLRAPNLRIVSNVTAQIIQDEITDPSYWARHTLGRVRFRESVEMLFKLGIRTFLEIAPRPTLTPLGMQCATDDGAVWLSTLRPRKDVWKALTEAVCSLYESGHFIDWEGFDKDYSRKRVHLPTYPFQGERYWVGDEDVIQECDFGHESETSLECIDSITLPPGTSELLRLNWVWEAAPCPKTPESKGCLVLISEATSGVVDRLTEALHSASSRVVFVPLDGQDIGAGIASVLKKLDAAGETAIDVVVLRIKRNRPNLQDLVLATEDECVLFLETVRAILSVGSTSIRLSLVTEEAVVCQGTVPDLAVAPVWAVARVVMNEYPDLRCRCIDVSTLHVTRDITELAHELLVPEDENTIALRPTGRYVGRLREKDEEVTKHDPLVLDAEATYVVTGGFGGLGILVAEWLARRGAGHIALFGWRLPGEHATRSIEIMRRAGQRISVHEVDVADGIAIKTLLKDLQSAHGRIAGVVHAAGTMDDGVVLHLNRERFRTVMRPKIGGALSIHQALEALGQTPDFFVLFSSATPLIGNPGQANHAAANAFLDAFAHWRRAQGKRTVSINWGAWGGAGHIAEDSVTRRRLEERGFELIQPGYGISALELAITSDITQIGIAPIRWNLMFPALGLDASPFYMALSPGNSPALGARASDDGATSVVNLYDLLHQEAARVLGKSNRELDDNIPLLNLGLDSLGAIQLRNAIQKRLGRPLSPAFAFEYPTLARMKQYLDEFGVQDPPRPLVASPKVRPLAEIPLSTQQRRWLSLIRRGYGQRVVPIVFWSQLNSEALREALLFVVTRHELLRYRYPQDRIEILDAKDVVPDVRELIIDLGDLKAVDREREIGRIYEEMRHGLPDPAIRPSWLVRCIRLSRERFAIMLGLQHIEFEGTSLSLFVDEVRHAYRAITNAEQPSLPPPAQYCEYAQEQAEYVLREADTDGAFFAGMFAGLETVSVLPHHSGYTETRALPSKRYTARIVNGLWICLAHQASVLGVTPFSLVFTLYARLVAEIIGTNDVVVGMIAGGRTDARFADTIGPFTSPVPVRHIVLEEPFDRSVRRCHELLTAIQGRNRYPVSRLPKDVALFRQFPMEAYFADASINFTNYQRQDDRREPRVEILEILGAVDDQDFSRINTSALRRIPGLHLVVSFVHGEVRFNFWYHSERFTENDVAQWAERLLELARAALAS